MRKENLGKNLSQRKSSVRLNVESDKNELYEELYKIALKNMDNAYAKYSGFRVSAALLDEDGNMKYTQFNPIYFMGDDNKRVYRYFNEQSKNYGENMGCSSEEDEYNPLCG